jgi:hypothetical protein
MAARAMADTSDSLRRGMSSLQRALHLIAAAYPADRR